MSASSGPTPDVSAAPTVEELRSLFFEVMHGQREHLERCAAAQGLTGQLAIALLQLWRPWPSACPGRGAAVTEGEPPGRGEGSGMPMRELAGRISCDPSQLTGIADRLEHLGLVERRPDAGDRRVKLLVVTDAGGRIAQQLAEQINGGAPGFSALDDAERATLGALLRTVADATAP